MTRFDDSTPVASVARPRAGSGIRSAVTRRRLLFALYGALIVLGAGLGRQLLEIAWPYLEPAHGASLRWVIAAAIVVYAVVMAVPFVPAAEIGLSLLLLFGPQVALLVYLSTVLALMLPYLIGRAVSSLKRRRDSSPRCCGIAISRSRSFSIFPATHCSAVARASRCAPASAGCTRHTVSSWRSQLP